MASAEVEFISPLLHSDTDQICHRARILRCAICSACGHTIYKRIHMPLIAFGLYCERCCPCQAAVLTEEEQEAIRINRRNSVKQARSGAAVAKRRWDDPEFRRRHKAGMRAFWAARKRAAAASR